MSVIHHILSYPPYPVKGWGQIQWALKAKAHQGRPIGYVMGFKDLIVFSSNLKKTGKVESQILPIIWYWEENEKSACFMNKDGFFFGVAEVITGFESFVFTGFESFVFTDLFPGCTLHIFGAFVCEHYQIFKCHSCYQRNQKIRVKKLSDGRPKDSTRIRTLYLFPRQSI